MFDGRASAAMHALRRRRQDRGSRRGRKHGPRPARVSAATPHGAYMASASTPNAAARPSRSLDDRGVKGPWLEGVSRRNSSTRFKGYHTFRLITGQLQAKAGSIAQRRLGPYLAAHAMSLNSAAVFDAIFSHAAASGYFERVNLHEPKNAPGNGSPPPCGLTASTPSARSGLASTSARVTIMLRIYQNMLSSRKTSSTPTSPPRGRADGRLQRRLRARRLGPPHRHLRRVGRLRAASESRLSRHRQETLSGHGLTIPVTHQRCVGAGGLGGQTRRHG